VKPKNILLTPQGVAKLTDLGLARATDDKDAAESEAGKAYGTPYYISPEQIRGDVDIDYRADIYSLGATLYHLVTGRPPFDGETPSAVMHKHLKQPLVPADHLNTSLSAGLGEIIDLAMQKDREDRYRTTEDMLEDLEAVARGTPPPHAHQNIDLGKLGELEKKGATVDIDKEQVQTLELWNHPAVIGLMAAVGVSVLANVVLLVFLLTKK
jgi:serine/threonine-protein kinase